MNRILLIVLVLIAPFALAQEGETVQERTPLSADVLWQMDRVGSPVISPDGSQVVVPVTGYDVETDEPSTRLWLMSSDGEGGHEPQRPLTGEGLSVSSPVFSPDGQQLAFVSSRDDDEAGQIYLLPMTEPGEATRLSDVPTGSGSLKWVGGHIYFISSIWPDMDFDQMAEQIKEDKDSHLSAHTWNALPYSFFDHWIDEDRQAHVFRIPAEGGVVQNLTLPSGLQLSRSSQSSASYDVAPDESQLAIVSDSANSGTRPDMDVFLIELNDNGGSDDGVNLTQGNAGTDANPMFSPDGRMLAFNRQHIPGFYGDTRFLMVHDLANSDTRLLHDEWDRSADGLVWSPDSAGLFGAIDDEATRRVYFLPLSSSDPVAITTDTSYGSLSIAEDGTLVAANQSFLYPPRVVRIDPETRETTRLDTFNDELLSTVDLGTYESVTYTGADGADIQMWVHYPPGFDPDQEYPLFLLIHGGPHGAIGDQFHFRWNAQTFASWGYVTAWHNFHGSSGFGQEFTDSINPDWLTKPYQDTIAAADWFAEKPWIDEERMVAGGGSYGGYLSSILLGREHPFNALVIHAAVYNMYSQMAADFSVHGIRFGEYWENPDIYRSISPHYFAENFNTPSLIIHGQWDLRVPVGQAFELFRTLQTRGVESRLIYYPDENHWILKPNNSLYWYGQVREWVERFATPGAGGGS